MPWRQVGQFAPWLHIYKSQLSASECLDWIAALIPPRRKHWHRYFGVLAPNSLWRAVVATNVGRKPGAGSAMSAVQRATVCAHQHYLRLFEPEVDKDAPESCVVFFDAVV